MAAQCPDRSSDPAGAPIGEGKDDACSMFMQLVAVSAQYPLSNHKFYGDPSAPFTFCGQVVRRTPALDQMLEEYRSNDRALDVLIAVTGTPDPREQPRQPPPQQPQGPQIGSASAGGASASAAVRRGSAGGSGGL